jgi:glycosylphosphatidylinositol deacylase
MLWTIPAINLPILIVWIHNLAVQWLTPFSSHHNVLSIVPFILLVETMASGTMIPRLPGRLRYISSLLFMGIAACAAVWGVSYAYMLHHLVNIVAAWLLAVHLSSNSWSTGISWTALLSGMSGGQSAGGVDCKSSEKTGPENHRFEK